MVAHPPVALLSRHLVDTGHEAVSGTHVGKGLDRKLRFQFEPPVALAIAHARGQALVFVPLFEVPGVEVQRRLRIHLEGDGAESPAGIVDGVDAQLAGAVGAVDEPHEAFQPSVSGRHHQGKRRGAGDASGARIEIGHERAVIGVRTLARALPEGVRHQRLHHAAAEHQVVDELDEAGIATGNATRRYQSKGSLGRRERRPSRIAGNREATVEISEDDEVRPFPAPCIAPVLQ